MLLQLDKAIHTISYLLANVIRGIANGLFITFVHNLWVQRVI